MANAGIAIAALGAIGLGAYVLSNKKKKEGDGSGGNPPATPEDLPDTPTDSSIDAALSAGDELIGAAILMCPDKEGELLDAFKIFEEDLANGNSPADSLNALRSFVNANCPSMRGIPGLTEPPEPPDFTPPPGMRIPPGGPSTGSGNQFSSMSANALAERIKSEYDVGGCSALGQDLIRAFQRKHNTENGSSVLQENGLYDFTTAATVQIRLSAQGKGFAPQICHYPDFLPDHNNELIGLIDSFRDELEGYV